MDPYLRPPVLCCLYTTIIRQRKILEKLKKSKNTVKRMFVKIVYNS